MGSKTTLHLGERDDRSPTLAEDLARARGDGSLAKLVAAAGATEDEHRILKDLLVGECAKGW